MHGKLLFILEKLALQKLKSRCAFHKCEHFQLLKTRTQVPKALRWIKGGICLQVPRQKCNLKQKLRLSMFCFQKSHSTPLDWFLFRDSPKHDGATFLLLIMALDFLPASAQDNFLCIALTSTRGRGRRAGHTIAQILWHTVCGYRSRDNNIGSSPF